MRVALELDHCSIAAQVLKAEALLRKGDHGAAGELARQAADARTDAIRRSPGSPPRPSTGPRRAGRASARSRASNAIGYVSGSVEVAPRTIRATRPTRRIPATTMTTRRPTTARWTYTRPTSVSAPHAKRAADPQAAERTPDAVALAVGDRSGTVEVDPLDEADDRARRRLRRARLAAELVARGPQKIEDVRGSVQRSTKRRRCPNRRRAGERQRARRARTRTPPASSSTATTSRWRWRHRHRRGVRSDPTAQGQVATAVRNAVNVAPGPFAEAPSARRPTQLEAKEQQLARSPADGTRADRARADHLAQLSRRSRSRSA